MNNKPKKKNVEKIKQYFLKQGIDINDIKSDHSKVKNVSVKPRTNK